MRIHSHNDQELPARPMGTSEKVLKFVPTISDYQIFRQLIADELRNGRLTPARRRRIVRYAAKLRMSAVEAGQLITACREETLKSSDPTERAHALRLVEPQATRISLPVKLSIAAVLIILVDLLVVRWLG